MLKLSALDALAMTPAGGPAGATEIELALLDHFAAVRPAGVPADATRSWSWSATRRGRPRSSDWASSSSSRAPCASCSTAPARSTPATSPCRAVTTDPGIDAADLAARTAIATDALRDARTQLAAALASGQPEALRAALARAAKLGVTAPPAAAPRWPSSTAASRPSPPPTATARASPRCSATASACCRA